MTVTIDNFFNQAEREHLAKLLTDPAFQKLLLFQQLSRPAILPPGADATGVAVAAGLAAGYEMAGRPFFDQFILAPDKLPPPEVYPDVNSDLYPKN